MPKIIDRENYGRRYREFEINKDYFFDKFDGVSVFHSTRPVNIKLSSRITNEQLTHDQAGMEICRDLNVPTEFFDGLIIEMSSEYKDQDIVANIESIRLNILTKCDLRDIIDNEFLKNDHKHRLEKLEHEHEINKIYLKQYDNLRENFRRVIFNILGNRYYNMSHDVYKSDEYACNDIISIFRKKENYIKNLKFFNNLYIIFIVTLVLMLTMVIK